MTWKIVAIVAVAMATGAWSLRRHRVSRRFRLKFDVEWNQEGVASPPTDASSGQQSGEDGPAG